MKKPAALTAVAALTPVVLAAVDILELQAKLPDCSLECIAEGAAKFDCEITDLSCQCSQMEAITQEVSPCLVNKGGCSFEQITDTASVVAEACRENAESNTRGGGNSTSNDSASPTSSSEEESQPTETPDAASTLQRAGLAGAVVMAAAAAML